MIWTVQLSADPASPAAARQFVIEVLGPPDDVFDVAELLTSELATNVVLHARTPLELSVEVKPGTVRIAVRDASPEPPVLRSYNQTAITGRGLQLLDRLADRWGVDADEHGKTVWFERVRPGSRRRTIATTRRRAETKRPPHASRPSGRPPRWRRRRPEARRR